jgi:beta-lactamase regulating signal transducer with metallopeptidase domain
MNKAYLLALSTMALLMVTAFVLPGIQTANAQYTGGGGEGTSSSSIEEQLKLAREKTSLAEQQGAYGSGTSMVSGNIDSTILFIIALVVIFGAVSAAFFIKSRGARRAVTKQSSRESEPDWKLEAQRYKEELDAMKRNQNR